MLFSIWPNFKLKPLSASAQAHLSMFAIDVKSTVQQTCRTPLSLKLIEHRAWSRPCSRRLHTPAFCNTFVDYEIEVTNRQSYPNIYQIKLLQKSGHQLGHFGNRVRHISTAICRSGSVNDWQSLIEPLLLHSICGIVGLNISLASSG